MELIRFDAQMTEARNKELAELKSATERRIEEEKRRIQERADKMVENAEAVTRETLAACRAESEERVKRVIVESDTKVSRLNTRDVFSVWKFLRSTNLKLNNYCFVLGEEYGQRSEKSC